jgi:hypothetical protein
MLSTSGVNTAPTSLATARDDDLAVGRGKTYGIMFDVESAAGVSPSSSLAIVGMDLYLADVTLPTHFEVWTKPGSWQDSDAAVARLGAPENRPAADYLAGFRRVSHGTLPERAPASSSQFTKVPFRDVVLAGGEGVRQAFWITLSDNLLLFRSRQSHGGSGRTVQASNAELRVFLGMAVRTYPLELADPASDFWNDAGFLGRIWTKLV